MKIKELKLKFERVGETLSRVTATDEAGQLRAELVYVYWSDLVEFVQMCLEKAYKVTA
ncbi:MAG TPA: hypothetical protein VIY48_01935 [Candidatus Paceibacterota bacterium]